MPNTYFFKTSKHFDALKEDTLDNAWIQNITCFSFPNLKLKPLRIKQVVL